MRNTSHTNLPKHYKSADLYLNYRVESWCNLYRVSHQKCRLYHLAAKVVTR